MSKNVDSCEDRFIVGREFSGRIFSKVRFSEDSNQIVTISPLTSRKKINLWWTSAERKESLLSNEDRVPMSCVKMDGGLCKTKSFGNMSEYLTSTSRIDDICSVSLASESEDANEHVQDDGCLEF